MDAKVKSSDAKKEKLFTWFETGLWREKTRSPNISLGSGSKFRIAVRGSLEAATDCAAPYEQLSERQQYTSKAKKPQGDTND